MCTFRSLFQQGLSQKEEVLETCVFKHYLNGQHPGAQQSPTPVPTCSTFCMLHLILCQLKDTIFCHIAGSLPNKILVEND